mgnify:CR=1 FL=1
MKLKQDCVRYVLLSLEDQNFKMTQRPVQGMEIANVLQNENYSVEDIRYTLLQLYDGGFLIARPLQTKLATDVVVSDISWKGHELLDSIRDDEVWKQTKKATSGLKSVSIGILSNVASTVLTGIIKQQTGLL